MAEHTPGGDNASEKAREEFFSEAQEIVDGLSRDLLALDEISRAGGSDAELVNDVFRAVHTLKGLSGLFGAAMMSGLSHELENLLDDLRLGRIELNSQVLDLLFQSVELYGRILGAAKGDGQEPAAEVRALLAALGQVSQQRGGAGNILVQYELDPALLGVLTEYEEHRLRTNLQEGLALYRMRVGFPLANIDSALDELKAKTRPHGEIITFLPTGEGGDTETIELEILVASRETLHTLRQATAGPNVLLEAVKRRDGATGTAASASTPKPVSETPALVRRLAPEPEESVIAPSSSKPQPAPTPPSAPHDASAGQRELTLRSVTQTVRVDIRKLDHLMNIVGELALVRTAVARMERRVRVESESRELAGDLQRLHRSFERHLGQMQKGILEVRMVPLGQVFEKLARIVRQISKEYDKQVHLVIAGADTELDKLIVEELSDPLMHMIRNAIDHGIEGRDERMRVGKPPVGTVALNAFQKGNHVVIEVEEDGRGMSPDVIARAAIVRGIATEAEAREMSTKDILALIFRPGFTTKGEATNLSGRGIGMDVVRTNIGRLGGVIDVASELGIGTKITLTLPITLAVISVLVVEVAGRTYCIPLANVDEAIVFDDSMLRTFEGREVMTQRGATLPIARLARLFQLQGFRAGVWVNEDAKTPKPPLVRHGKRPRNYVVITSAGARRVGFIVDRLVGQEDIVIKALGPSLRHARGFAGATDLGDQRVGLVLDASTLIDEVLAPLERSSAEPRLSS